MNTRPTQSKYPNRPRTPHRLGLLGCLGTVFALLFLFVLVLWLVAHRPEYKPLAECVEHMTQTRAALLRYHQHRGKWPDKLSDLSPTYLEHAHLLRCPLDSSKSGSYTYFKPSNNSKPDDPIIECDRHRVLGNRVLLRMRRDKEIPDTRVLTPADTPSR